MPKTWAGIEKGLGKKLDMNNKADHETAMNYLVSQNEKSLKSKNLPVNLSTLYMMHFSGKTKLVEAAIKSPNTPISSIFSAAEIKANPWLPKTAGAAAEKLSKKVGVKWANPGTNEIEARGLKFASKQYNIADRDKAWRMYRGEMGNAQKQLSGNELVIKQQQILKKYGDLGWIGKDENGKNAGGFNDIVRESNTINENNTKKKAEAAFFIANNLEDILAKNNINGDKGKLGNSITYDVQNGRNIIKKSSGISTERLSGEVIGALETVLGKKVSDIKTISTRDLLGKLEGQINLFVPKGQEVDLINHKTGARGKDLAFEGANGGANKEVGSTSASKVYIPDLKKGNQGFKAFGMNITNSYDKRQLKYDSKNNFGYKKMDLISVPEGMETPVYQPDAGSEDVPSAYGPEPTSDNAPQASETNSESGVSVGENYATPEGVAQQIAANEAKKTENKAVDDWVKMFTAVSNSEAPKAYSYDPSSFKKELPLAELATAAGMLLSGKKMAETESPERDEMVSEGYRNYAQELEKLSTIGLRPEEEAYAKRMLSESYSSGIEQIKNASNGNRNLVLANMGRLDMQKQTGLMQLAVADSQAKEQAFYKYGEAMKFISDFEANKSIANNERKYQNSMMDKQVGAQMMQGGIKGMLDTIQNYKDTKPGSAHHAYKSYMMQKMFDINPSIKDNGLGNTPGTPSYKKVMDEKALTASTQNKELAENILSLPTKQRDQIIQTFNQYGYNDKTKSLVNFAKENKPTGDLDFTKIESAMEKGDWSAAYSGSTPAESVSTPVQETKEESKINPNIFDKIFNPGKPKLSEDSNQGVKVDSDNTLLKIDPLEYKEKENPFALPKLPSLNLGFMDFDKFSTNDIKL